MLTRRVPSCPHDEWQPFRQACHCCGIQDHFDFRVTDEVWAKVIPERFQTAPICLRCFDAFAAERDIAYATELHRLDFVGDRGTFGFVPVVAVDYDEWA